MKRRNRVAAHPREIPKWGGVPRAMPPGKVERTKLIVVGGGLVGAAVAYGEARLDVPVLLLI